MEVRSESGIMSGREPFSVAMHRTPSPQSLMTLNMQLAYAAEPLSTVSPPSFHGGGGGVVGAATAASSGGDGHSPAMPPHGLYINMGEPLKRKRGRPRKYGPDGTMALALAPVTLAAPGPTSSSRTANHASASSPTAVMKKARGRPPGSGRKQQIDALGSTGIGFTPYVITVKAGEIGEDAQIEEEFSSSKKNLVWTEAMDCCLTDALVEQMQRGNKIDRSFTNNAYLAACDAIYVQFGKKVSVLHLKNRLKTLKKDLTAFQNMENSASGFSFNRVTRMMDAEPSVWDSYIKAHPEARQFRYKPVPSFENLRILFGKDRVRSEGSETAKEKHLLMEKERDEMNVSNRDHLEETKIEIDAESGGESINTSGMPEQAPNDSLCKAFPKMTSRRKPGAINDLKEEFSMLKGGIHAVSSAIDRCASRMITEEKLFEEVRKIEGLDVDFQLLAYDYLCQDVTRGRTFIGLPIDFRKRWLELKLDRRVG